MARPAKFTEREVLDRATDLFWRDGCDAVSIRDLEVALELRAPSIYRRFSNKDQLIARCVDRYVEGVVGGRIRRFLDDADDPIDGLRSFFTSALEPFRGEDTPRGCLLTVTAGQAAFDAPEIRAAVVAGFALIEAALRTQVERAQAAGCMRDDIAVDAIASSLLVSFQGVLVLARSGSPGLSASIDATFAALAQCRRRR